MIRRFAAACLIFFCLFSVDSHAKKFSDVAKECFVKDENCNLFDRYIHDNLSSFLNLEEKCRKDFLKNGTNSPEITDSCLNASIWESTTGRAFSNEAEKYSPGSASEILCLYGNGKIDDIFLKRACFSAGMYISNTRRNRGGLMNSQENIICYNNCLLNFISIIENNQPNFRLLDADSFVYDSCELVRDDLELDSEKGIDHGIKLKSTAYRTLIKGLEQKINKIQNQNEKIMFYNKNRKSIEYLHEYLNNTDKRKQELLGEQKEKHDYEDISL